MNARRERCLDVMGIGRWERRDQPPVAASTISAELPGTASPESWPSGTRGGSPATTGALRPDPVVAAAGPGPGMPAPADTTSGADATVAAGDADSPATLTLDMLAAKVAGCTACGLAATRRQTVFGTGGRDARVMVIGEAPGAEEDRQGVPFVGPAGQLLNAMLRSVGLSRDDVYIANILKCRPPRNRDPEAGEVSACSPFLLAQIERVDPLLLMAVGRIAAQTLLGSTTAIGRLRTGRHSYAGRPLLVTYHPAYLLRSPLEKRKAWADLRAMRSLLVQAEAAR